MKTLLSMIMTVVLALSLPINPVAVRAATITQDTEEKSGEISIEYEVEESYTVVIPANVTFTNDEKTVERGLQVSKVIIDEGKELHVIVSSQNDFQMKYRGGYIDYRLMINYNPFLEKNNTTVLIVEAGESSGLAILTFVTELNTDHAKYTGNYTDTLTFTVSVE